MACEQHSAHEARLDAVERQIEDIYKKVHGLEKSTTKTEVQLEMILESIEKLDKKIDGLSKSPMPELIPSKHSFWDTKTGQSIPWIVGLIILITVVALTGQNIANALTATKDFIPTK